MERLAIWLRKLGSQDTNNHLPKMVLTSAFFLT
jgi:hypothetical protein